MSSEIRNVDAVIIEIGYGGPIVEAKTSFLIKFWEELLHASVEGFPVISRDKKFIMEFIANPEYLY